MVAAASKLRTVSTQQSVWELYWCMRSILRILVSVQESVMLTIHVSVTIFSAVAKTVV